MTSVDPAYPAKPGHAAMRIKRHPRWLIAGVLAVALGGLTTAYAVSALTASDDVVQLTRTVHRGETVAAADLAVVSINRAPGLSTVPASEASSIVGQVAATDLPGGSLLVQGSVGAPEVAPGLARLGLRLAPGRYPSGGLPPGTSVLVVALPEPQGAGTPAPLPHSVSASTAAQPAAQPDGSVVIDIVVKASEAESVARLAASDRVALVRQGGAQ